MFRTVQMLFDVGDTTFAKLEYSCARCAVPLCWENDSFSKQREDSPSELPPADQQLTLTSFDVLLLEGAWDEVKVALQKMYTRDRDQDYLITCLGIFRWVPLASTTSKSCATCTQNPGAGCLVVFNYTSGAVDPTVHSLVAGSREYDALKFVGTE
ncbi:hypothetical protein B0H10DRAFT_1941813 [Mycena sp. CBHHK59/15]|nr:hypothetical protein B0H10DRAFT_1941813 [Mycena sp. CBHHK59/15]